MHIARGNESLANYEKKQLAKALSKRLLSEKNYILLRGGERKRNLLF